MVMDGRISTPLFENHELHLEYRWYEGAEGGDMSFRSRNELM